MALDKFQRTIAEVVLADGTHVNHTLIRDSWCWWHRKYAPRNRELERLEKTAQEAWKGL
jgi:micrococcal nuclease